MIKFKNILSERTTDFLKWKRKNVTIRGISNLPGDENNGMAKYGQGLYTAFLSNKEMARQYGDIYYVVNAIPTHPKITYSVNDAEMFLQKIVTDYCKKHNVPRSNYYFSDNTTIAAEMKDLGYDGLIIKGREMVNYFPPNDVKYFKTDAALENYFNTL